MPGRPEDATRGRLCWGAPWAPRFSPLRTQRHRGAPSRGAGALGTSLLEAPPRQRRSPQQNRNGAPTEDIKLALPFCNLVTIGLGSKMAKGLLEILGFQALGISCCLSKTNFFKQGPAPPAWTSEFGARVPSYHENGSSPPEFSMQLNVVQSTGSIWENPMPLWFLKHSSKRQNLPAFFTFQARFWTC